MADVGQRDSLFNPNELGSLGFEEAHNTPVTLDALSAVDSVGAISAITLTGGFPGPDATDIFSFTTSGVDTISFTLQDLGNGSYANTIIVEPLSGVSKVDGDILGIWTTGSHRNSDFSDIIEEAAEQTFDDAASGRLVTGFDVSEISYSQNDEISATWTLDGGPVIFEVTGFQLEGSLPSSPFIPVSEVQYAFEIIPQDRSFSDIGNGGLLFEDNFSVSETHTGRETIDTYSVDGVLLNFNITPNEDGELVVENDRFSFASDTLIDIERIQFNDGYLAFDTDGNAGQIYRLYQAAFDRDPDVAGLGHWIDTFDRGLFDLKGVAQEFLISEEFKLRFGTEETLDNQGYLTLLYNNVLDRDPDQAGFDFWSDQQDQGLSRADILQYFSESEENFANVAAEIDAGIFYL